MIKIHRSKQVARVGRRTIELSKQEHELLIALGMLDNKLTPQEILLEIVSDGRQPLPSDKNLLLTRILRLRRKIGAERLLCHKNFGYILEGDVQFYG